MFTEKFDLYRHEWLELVFNGRNKNYGAYELRSQNQQRTLKALFFGATLFILPFAIAYFNTQKTKEAVVEKIVEANLTRIVVPQPKIVEPPKQVARKSPAPKSATKKFVAPKVVPDARAVEPPTQKELVDVQIGQEDIIGEKDTENIVTKTDESKGEGTKSADDNGTYTAGMVDRMPEFNGGFEAWAKFLQKNLRYPSVAVDNNISGRVTVSFVVERDGSLTDIHVIKGIGFGCDEEAVRVLKKAPAWKPGFQNGRPVRVQYTLPLNFKLD